MSGAGVMAGRAVRPGRVASRLRGWCGRLAPAVLGLALGALALGPGLGPGFVLRYDMVFVPSPPWSASALGLVGGPPRAFPSTAVVTALATVLPAALVQKAILLGIFALAAAGAARLLAGAPLLARLAAAAVYVWNPYVAERLLIGQWALLLGYAALPWALHAAARLIPAGGAGADAVWRRAGVLAAALAPAAAGGFAAMTICAPTVLAAAVIRRGRRVRAGVTALAVLVALALPWLVPALLGPPVTTDPAGVDAFAARADTPFGTLGSLLALGGVWNREVVPSGYGHGPAVYLWLVFVVAGLATFLWARRLPGRAAMRPGLLAGAVAGYCVAAVGGVAVGRQALRWLVGVVPAFGVVRDGQRFVAPLALVVALGIGVAVRALVRACARREAAGPGRVLGGLAALVPLMLLPTLAFGAAGRIAAVSYPLDWARARAVVDGDPAPGVLLVLPWSAYRGFAWNGGRTVVDPAPMFFGRRVVWNDGLRVGHRTLSPEDPAARAVTGALARPGPVIGPGGRVTGTSIRVRYVLVERRPGEGGDRRGRALVENLFQGRGLAIFPMLKGTDISLYRLVTSR